MHAGKETVLITGSTVGIGLALSRVFAAGGSNLILVARNREKLDQVAQVGYRGFRNGTAVVIPGILNKLGPFSLRFAPRFLVRIITRWINSPA